MQADREQTDISAIIRELHGVVDAAIMTQSTIAEPKANDDGIYDISKIDFERLRREFENSKTKRSTVQNLKEAVEKKLNQLLLQNPLRTDFQNHYQQLVEGYNKEKDRVTIEKTFADLMNLVKTMDDEGQRATRENLSEESLVVFDLLLKPDPNKKDIQRIKKVAVELLATLKAERLKIDNWRDKEASRDAVKQQIHDFLYDETTGLPVDDYSEAEIETLTENVFSHISWAYPTVPSPIYR